MKLLSTNRVAKILDVQPRTVARWCRQGKFPSATKLGRVWRIAYDDLQLHKLVYKRGANILSERAL